MLIVAVVVVVVVVVVHPSRVTLAAGMADEVHLCQLLLRVPDRTRLGPPRPRLQRHHPLHPRDARLKSFGAERTPRARALHE
eukprot:CAMPEP_0202797110 /NCGR_PEP_ID=MMETSP1388-20130828/93481_1 /ASSEMBLY_ACC=CAM_ASM_000864 /TAXON_ID=37098 /ORGANISM="Isochrysis sp, Strain CCMP1244" /LENGTH=81 /DNA_ID=CAMNT_0049467017 /DNA_START=349 /DNA_END=591 /DNA_ORIENTATION=+